MFKVNGISIKNPTSFRIERFNITTMARLSNADMVGDLVAKKKKFYFTYAYLSAQNLDNILEAIWDTEDLFFTLEYPYQGEQRTVKVYTGSIPTELHQAAQGDNWVWRNVTFNLIER